MKTKLLIMFLNMFITKAIHFTLSLYTYSCKWQQFSSYSKFDCKNIITYFNKNYISNEAFPIIFTF